MVKETFYKPVCPGDSALGDGQSQPHITPAIIDRLNKLLDFTEPGVLREHLLEIYHVYIIQEHSSLPSNFKDVANSMYVLLDFLKFAQEECSRHK